MDLKFLEELKQKYIKNPPECMTTKLVRNMTDSDLLDMHYFICPLLAGYFIQCFSERSNFLLHKK